LHISGDDTLRGDGKAQISNRPDQQNPCPDIDIDAIFERTHPASHDDLRNIGNGCIGDTAEKSRTRRKLDAPVRAASLPRKFPQKIPAPRPRNRARMIIHTRPPLYSRWLKHILHQKEKPLTGKGWTRLVFERLTVLNDARVNW